ncbi:methyltransferase domain-containing protein [Candidatus Pacearchaeota archaeon]|nr:methyltransferase domain-containing protein [Candidatus Pacearchaeota archaeon]
MDIKKRQVKKLHLGCGRKYKEGFINLDISKNVKADVYHDLNKYPYPFKDNTFDYIYADNVLEILTSITKPMEELSRISKKGAIIEIIVPLAPTSHAFRDPTHKTFFTYRTFEYFLDGSGLNYYSKARFEIIKRRIIFHNRLGFLTKLINLNESFCKFLCEFFSQFFPPAFIHVRLRVKK